ncbi:MAG: oligosaccharide repeat unit polymerase [Gammaproteobacteria bacterium]|jgi:oligosaccharide repeat unit polymerase|nr:oligosaccharide repeat unit polymerase [Gammaproteobacteria bacterium]
MSEIRIDNRGFVLNIILSPLFIFPAIWLLGIAIYIFAKDFSFIFNQNYQILFLIFSLSNIIFIGAYLSFRLNINKLLIRDINSFEMNLNQNKVRRVKGVLVFFALIIVIYNLYSSGLFPILRIYNSDVENYFEYGRFKGLLIPLLNVIGLLNIFEKNKFSKTLFFILVISIFIFYILRGPLILFLFQYFIISVVFRRNNIHPALKSSLLLLILYGVIVILGDIRIVKAGFMYAFSIKPQYQDLNLGLLWIMTYFATPISDMITTVQYQTNYLFGISTINDVLPAFIQFEPTDANATLNFIDGPKTYLAPSYEDFGWIGIICTNYVIALICFILKYDSRFYKNFLIVALLYSSLTFIFFTNYFFYFSTIVQFILSLIIFNIIQENQLKLDYETN